jgi:hypothetical protein
VAGVWSSPPRLRAREAREAAAEAVTTQPMPIHSAGRRRWDKIARPTRAAIAGCSDIQTPKSWAEIRRSASSSSQYGMAEERMPMAAPTASSSGRNMCLPPAATPGIVTTAAATHIAITSPADPGIRWPVLLLPMM